MTMISKNDLMASVEFEVAVKETASKIMGLLSELGDNGVEGKFTADEVQTSAIALCLGSSIGAEVMMQYIKLQATAMEVKDGKVVPKETMEGIVSAASVFKYFTDTALKMLVDLHSGVALGVGAAMDMSKDKMPDEIKEYGHEKVADHVSQKGSASFMNAFKIATGKYDPSKLEIIIQQEGMRVQ